MNCPTCKAEAQRFGTNRNGSQRYRCVECKKTFSAKVSRLSGSTIPMDTVEKVLQLLIEGCSVRSAERISGLHRDTILKIMVTAGERCEKLMGRLIVNVPVKDVQADEIWSFIGKKEKRVTEDDDPNYGDAYCFVAMETSTKLVLNFALGKRNQATTDIFIEGLRHATAHGRFQISTDGFGPYTTAISNTLEDRADFAQLIKVYRATPEGERRYSPAEVVSTEVVSVMGDPDPKRTIGPPSACTSLITTFAGFIARCASHPQCKLGFQIKFGNCGTLFARSSTLCVGADRIHISPEKSYCRNSLHGFTRIARPHQGQD